MNFKCPNCLVPLKSVNADQAMFICDNCGLRSVHLKRFETVVSHLVGMRLKTSFDKTIQSDTRACPKCQSMLEVTGVSVRPGNAVEIDVCKPCATVWFDMGELEEFIASSADHSDLILPEQIRKQLYGLERDDEGNIIPHHESFRLSFKDFQFSFLKREGVATKWWQWAFALLGVPIEKYNPLKRKPWVTWALSLSCILVTLTCFSIGDHSGDGWIRYYGFFAHDPFANSGFNILAAFFLHGGYLHLLGNVYILNLFGDNVEDDLGHFLYFILIALATIAGDFILCFFFPYEQVPLIGASGGIAGLISYYAIRFPRASLSKNYFILFWFRFPAYAYVFLWVLLQILGARQQIAGFSHISYLSHIGGLFMGAFFAIFFKVNKRE